MILFRPVFKTIRSDIDLIKSPCIILLSNPFTNSNRFIDLRQYVHAVHRCIATRLIGLNYRINTIYKKSILVKKFGAA